MEPLSISENFLLKETSTTASLFVFCCCFFFFFFVFFCRNTEDPYRTVRDSSAFCFWPFRLADMVMPFSPLVAAYLISDVSYQARSNVILYVALRYYCNIQSNAISNNLMTVLHLRRMILT